LVNDEIREYVIDYANIFIGALEQCS